MKMTFDKILEIIERDRATRDKLNAEIQELILKESAFDAEMKAAAEAGNVDLFIEKSNEKAKVTSAIFVKRSYFDKLSSSVSTEMAKDAWTNYTADYDKRLVRAVSAFEAEKEKLFKMYSDMIDMQQEACAVREQLANAVSLNSDAFMLKTVPVQRGANVKGALRIGGTSILDPDFCYYLSHYIIKSGNNLILNPDDPVLRKAHAVLIKNSSK